MENSAAMVFSVWRIKKIIYPNPSIYRPGIVPTGFLHHELSLFCRYFAIDKLSVGILLYFL